MISDINYGKKVDRFVDGLKFNVKVEVLKTNCSSFEECARIALNIDSAIWRARRGPSAFQYGNHGKSESTPMEIGKMTSGPPIKARPEQRKIYMEKGACFKCHKEWGRPWKCSQSCVNNVDANPAASSRDQTTVFISDSENDLIVLKLIELCSGRIEKEHKIRAQRYRTSTR